MDPAIFIGKVDIHRGIKINSCDNVCHDLADFEKKLESSLGQWKNDKLRGIWFNVALPQIEWIPILVKRGFTIHHAREEEISMCLWLAENEPNKLPHYAHYMIGAGAVVINDKKQILVVRERYREIRYWKLPGGTSDLGEDIGETAIREVLEETSIQTEFESLVAIRYAKRSFFPGCSDMYFVVRLRPITHEISREESEIEDCKWMDIDVFLNHPEVHENNRMFVRQAVENEKEGVLAKREHDIHPVTKAPQFIYSIHKSDL